MFSVNVIPASLDHICFVILPSVSDLVLITWNSISFNMIAGNLDYKLT